MKLALFTVATLFAGLFALHRAGAKRSGAWAFAAACLLGLAYSIDHLLRRF